MKIQYVTVKKFFNVVCESKIKRIEKHPEELLSDEESEEKGITTFHTKLFQVSPAEGASSPQPAHSSVGVGGSLSGADGAETQNEVRAAL